jgi:hypothetical protein
MFDWSLLICNYIKNGMLLSLSSGKIKRGKF